MNHAAPAAWAGGEGGVGLTVPAQLSPDRRAGAFPWRVPLLTTGGGAAGPQWELLSSSGPGDAPVSHTSQGEESGGDTAAQKGKGQGKGL